MLAGVFCSCSKPAQSSKTTSKSTVKTAKKMSKKELRNLIKYSDFRGVVYVTRDSKPIFRYSTGKTSNKNGKKENRDTAFAIGELTKQFTAAAILRLKEKGLLSLDDTIDLYFPDYKLGKQNTIHNLLSMRSGIPDYTFETDTLVSKYGVKKHTRYAKNRSKIRKWIFEQDLNFKAGKHYQYSSSNYLLLSEIIEQVSGTNYGAYLRKQFFKPLQMTRTGFLETYDLEGENYAQPLKKTYDVMTYRGAAFGVGSIVSTASDLSKWLDALDGGQVVNPESFGQMISSYSDYTPYGYGYGLMIEQGGRYFHTGSIASCNAMVDVDKDSRVHLVMLSNTDANKMTDLAKTIVTELG